MEGIQSFFTESTLREVKDKLKQQMMSDRYNVYIKDLSVESVNGNRIILNAPMHSSIGVLNSKFKDLLETTISDITKFKYHIIFQVEGENKKEENDSSQSLNPRYNFEEFIVGGGNEFAMSAAKLVAETNLKYYNPLFIYGGVGLGKTHLIQAIGNHVIKNNPQAKVSYITSEKFLNEFIQSLKNKNPEEFRKKYRNVDVLIIDDVQFIGGKDSIQEELFNTFNELHSKDKHIVLASDRKPNELSDIEERLISRFAWGLIADIKPPDYETRVAILRKKMDSVKINIPLYIIDLIATEIKSNVRDLEGCFNTLVQTCVLTGVEPSENVANQAIERYVKNNKKTQNFYIRYKINSRRPLSCICRRNR